MHSEASGAVLKQFQQNPWPKNFFTGRPQFTQVIVPVNRMVRGPPT